MDIGKEIRRRRRALNWTLEYLANLVESDTGNLSRIETGKQGASADMLRRIATALGCAPADLFSEGDDRAGGVPAGARRIRILGAEQIVALGQTLALETGNIGEWLFTEQDLAKEAFAMRLRDESMAPVFAVGDTVIIDPSRLPVPGDFVLAIADEQEILLRRYKLVEIDKAGKSVFELVPLNEDYPSLRSDRAAIKHLGVVMEHRRYWKRRFF